MLAPQLLAALLVLFTVSPALGQNSTGMQYNGEGYIACPSDDYELQPCTLGIDRDCSVQDLFACNFTLDFLPTFSDDLMTIYVPLLCECYIATDCPSTCTFNEGNAPTRPSVGLETFVGSGIVTCIAADYVKAPCIPSIDNSTSCESCDTTTFVENATDFQFGDEFINFPLPCECFVMRDCPDTCTFTPGSNKTRPPVSLEDFNGIGVVTCITADYVNAPCLPSIDNATSCESCDASTFVENATEFQFGDEFITFPLLCECFVMKNCPDTCTFTPGSNETRPPVGLEDFNGVGTVTCITADYVNAPCLPSIDNFTSCESCDVSTFSENATEFQFGDEFISFPLLCECFVMRNCPDTCNFTTVSTPIGVPAPTPMTGTTSEDSNTTSPSLVPATDVPTPTSRTNATAPRRAPTSMVTVPTPTSNNNNTSSSAYENHCSRNFVIMIFGIFSLMISFM